MEMIRCGRWRRKINNYLFKFSLDIDDKCAILKVAKV